MEVKQGEILAGKYRIERVLGQGGMGVVVAATHLHLDQLVALKFLLPEAITNSEIQGRFAREARAAAKMRSEHVARVIDVGMLETGMPFIVMEYLQGTDLSDYARQQGPLPIAQAVELTLQACEGLAEAHSLGIVHRDLKPANLFLAERPDRTVCLKILDFGISKVGASAAGTTDFAMTKTGAVLGSPYYMPPEQMRSSRAVDARADIWSLGVILYELVVGRVPFDAPSLPHLCAMILTDPLPAPRTLKPDIPPRFEAVLLRCLEKEPENRYQNVGDFAIALAEFVPEAVARPSIERVLRLLGGSLQGSVSGARSSSSSPTRPEPATHTDWGGTSARSGRSRGAWAVLAALVVLGGVGAWGIAELRAGSHAPPSGTTARGASTGAESAVAAPVDPRATSAAAQSLAPLTESSPPTASLAATDAATPARPVRDIPPGPNRPPAPASKRASSPAPSAAAAAASPASAPSSLPPRPVAAPNPLDGRL
jgi:serine/threonine-protein kinase